MTDKNMFFWSLTLKPVGQLAGASAHVQYSKIYFPTQRKLDQWKKKHPEEEKTAEWGMHEISVSCAKDLVKLSKKKPKEKCPECGK